MADRYPIPLGEASIEFTERNSIFIGTAGPAATIEEAQAFIGRISATYADASHNAWAYLVGFGPTAIYACHNNGEPGGTAGPPALAALQGSGLGDVVVVVTRYFGGVKLGTGGLVRAYGRGAREAVAALARGEHVTRRQMTVRIDYRFHDSFMRLLQSHEAQVEHTDYGAAVQFTLLLPADQYEALARTVTELTGGGAEIQVRPGASDPDDIPTGPDTARQTAN